MTSESRQSSAKWVWTASAIEAVSFLERLASRAEKFSQLPAGNALRIAAAMRDGRYRHDIALRDPVLEVRRNAALGRIEASLQKPTAIAKVPAE